MEFFNKDFKKFVNEHLNDDPAQLILQASKHKEIDMQKAVSQIIGKKKAKDKLPEWFENDDVLFPAKISMEQCSSSLTATFKSSLVNGNTGIDITGGFGVDSIFFSSQFDTFTYIEQQEELTQIVLHNTEVLGKTNMKVICGNGIKFLQDHNENFDFIYLDPARRDEHQEKVVKIEECEPNLLEHDMLLLEKAQKVMVKLSPMLDLKQAIRNVKHISNIYIIAVQNECKEILFVLEKETENKEPKIHCVNLHKQKPAQIFSFLFSEEETSASTYAEAPLSYIYEPNVAILKGGAYKSIGDTYGFKKLHPNSHLYTSDQLVADFQGRVFKVGKAFSLNKKELKKHLSEKKANITVRNFPMSVAELRKKLKIAEGGEIYLFATTNIKNEKILIKCSKA